MDEAYNKLKKLCTGRHDFSRDLMKEIREFQDDCKLPKFRRMDFSNNKMCADFHLVILVSKFSLGFKLLNHV